MKKENVIDFEQYKRNSEVSEPSCISRELELALQKLVLRLREVESIE